MSQPPSGGCVLKQHLIVSVAVGLEPAAFRRLCVETSGCLALGRALSPAAFRRLCVETIKLVIDGGNEDASRLQAAVC